MLLALQGNARHIPRPCIAPPPVNARCHVLASPASLRCLRSTCFSPGGQWSAVVAPSLFVYAVTRQRFITAPIFSLGLPPSRRRFRRIKKRAFKTAAQALRPRSTGEARIIRCFYRAGIAIFAAAGSIITFFLLKSFACT